MSLRAATAIAAASLLVFFCACTSRAPHVSGVLSPAPTGCGMVMGGLLGYSASPGSSPRELLAGHLPRWLPAGFGVEQLGAFDENGAVRWTDASCRSVTVSYRAGPYTPFPTGARVAPGTPSGPWTVLRPARGDLIYEAPASNGMVGLVSHGLDRALMDRIARAVPLQLSASPS